MTTDKTMGTQPIFIADVHLQQINNFAKPIKDSPITDRTQAMFDTLEKAFNIGIQRKSPIVIAGDLFDERRHVDTLIINRALQLIHQKVREMPIGVPLLVLQGNHDNVSNEPNTESSVDILDLLGSEQHPIRVFKTHVSQYTFQNIVYTFLPYTEDVETLKKELKQITEQPKQPNHKYILVGHVGVDGSDSGHYNHRLGGAFGLGDLFPDYFDFTFLGHYHLRQHLAPNVVYVGSTFPLNFNDVNQTKGIYLYDSNTNQADYKEIPNRLFQVVDTTRKEYTPEELADITSNNYVKFISTDQATIEAIQNNSEIKDFVNVEYRKEEKVESRLGVDPTADAKTVVQSYTRTYYPNAEEQALNILAEVAITN